jgi:hypothetical protein
VTIFLNIGILNNINKFAKFVHIGIFFLKFNILLYGYVIFAYISVNLTNVKMLIATLWLKLNHISTRLQLW